jgi:hypothetical protein
MPARPREILLKLAPNTGAKPKLLRGRGLAGLVMPPSEASGEAESGLSRKRYAR